MKYINAFLLLTLCFTIPTTLFPLSEDEKVMFDMISNLSETELQELIQTIDSEVSKMTPEEQKEFWSAVESEASRLEPQIAQYIEQQEPITPQPQETPKKPIKKVKPAKKKKTVEKEKKKSSHDTLNAAHTMIANLIKTIDSFLCIAQTVPQFDQEVQDWAEEKVLKHWQTGLTWSFFKDQVTTLSHKLKLLTSQDSEQQYKYLELLLEDTSLYNNIQQLQFKMSNTGQLEECSLETETLSLESEQIMQSMISSLYEAINMLHIIGSIDALIAKYKPIAEQSQEQELALQEQARKDSSISPPYQRPHIAGQEMGPSGFVSIPQYEPRPTSPPYPPTQPIPQRTAQPSLLDRQRSTQAQQTSHPSPQSPSGKSTGPQPLPSGTDTGKMPQPAPVAPVKKEASDKLANTVADGYVKDLNKALNSAIVTIEDANLKGIKNQVLGRGAVNTDLVFYIPQVTSQIKKAVTAAQSLKLRTKKFKGAQKAKYSKELRNSLQTHSPMLNGIATQIRDIRTNEANVSDEKAYAYLGGKRKEKVPALVQKIPNPANLYALENSIRDLLLVR